MGACTDARTFEAKTPLEAKKASMRIIHEDCHENGHSYSGSIGMASGVHYCAGQPKSDDAADSFIFGTEDLEGKAQKWGPAILVEIEPDPQSGARKWMLGAWCSS